MASKTGNKTSDLSQELSDKVQIVPKIGSQVPDLIQELLDKPQTFSFMQAVRLLCLYNRDSSGSAEDFLQHGISVIPQLSLGYPGSDITSVRKKSDDPVLYEIEATFLALYGTSSPLPTFYTEELIEESRNDESVSRDFLNVLNQDLYILFYKAVNKYKLAIQTLEQQNKDLLALHYAFMGFGNKFLREQAHVEFSDLRYIKNFIRYSRSGNGLKNYLVQLLDIIDIEVEECVLRYMTIPKKQRCYLGQKTATLGEAVLGTVIPDLSGKFSIHLRGLTQDEMVCFTYKGKGYVRIENSVRQYLNSMLDYDLVLYAVKDTMSCVMLGDENRSRLGVNTFLVDPRGLEPVQVRVHTIN